MNQDVIVQRASSLKTNKLATIVREHGSGHLRYDNFDDTLIVLFVDPQEETVARYVSQNVALLYEPDTFEVVGFQIEGFNTSFAKAAAAEHRERRFKLSDYEVQRDPSFDFSIIFLTEPIWNEFSYAGLGSRQSEVVARVPVFA